MSAITWVSVANSTAVLGRSVVLTVREPGTYRCNVRNPCGTTSAVSTISSELISIVAWLPPSEFSTNPLLSYTYSSCLITLFIPNTCSYLFTIRQGYQLYLSVHLSLGRVVTVVGSRLHQLVSTCVPSLVNVSPFVAQPTTLQPLLS